MANACTEEQTKDGEFSSLALDLARFQIQNAPFLSRYFGAPNWDKIERWDQLPLLPISAYKEARITSLGEGEDEVQFYSSGTTMKDRSCHYHDSNTLAVYKDSLLRWFHLHFRDRQPLTIISLTPCMGEAPHSSLVYMFHQIATVEGGGEWGFVGKSNPEGWVVDSGKFLEQLRGATEKEIPVLITGTAFNYVQLLDELDSKQDYTLPKGSLVLETGGYKGRTRELTKDALYLEIQKLFGITRKQIVSEYGMCELSSQGYDFEDAKQGRCFRMPPWARFRVLSPETGLELPEGETGILAIYDLANVASYAGLMTEDLAIRRADGFEWKARSSNNPVKGCSLFVAGK
ncbi:MAG: Long-chain-fatty-acid--luciferin-component ligase [Verrucomicrobiales bacterium]|nr:Long-chain-fatty-acid--luciferin-component ligase [Verrucomicrobiales bacterium]